MSPPNEPPVPTKIPDDLWHQINRVRTALLTFAYNARMSVEASELRTGEYDLEFYKWLEPLVDVASRMKGIKRYAPATAEVIPFPTNVVEAKDDQPDLRSAILTR
jgi:hypothetical protein